MTKKYTTNQPAPPPPPPRKERLQIHPIKSNYPSTADPIKPAINKQPTIRHQRRVPGIAVCGHQTRIIEIPIGAIRSWSEWESGEGPVGRRGWGSGGGRRGCHGWILGPVTATGFCTLAARQGLGDLGCGIVQRPGCPCLLLTV